MEALYMGEWDARSSMRVTSVSVLGFYIHSCQKMRYKGDYSPSYLVDPVRILQRVVFMTTDDEQETYAWYPLPGCLPLLEKNRYACFSNPSHSSNDLSQPNAESGKVNSPQLSQVILSCVIPSQQSLMSYHRLQRNSMVLE
jgi:hypothetical protein